MGADAVRERLDQGRALARTRAGGRLARRPVHGEHVVAVDAHPREPVPLGAFPDLADGLTMGRHADRPSVVLAEQDRRGLEDPRHVRRLVEVALARAAVAEVGRACRPAPRRATGPWRSPRRGRSGSPPGCRSARTASPADRTGHRARCPGDTRGTAPGRRRARAQQRARGTSGTPSPRARAPIALPTCAASCPSKPGYTVSSPCRWRAMHSRSSRRASIIERSIVRRASGSRPTSGSPTAVPSGASTRSGSVPRQCSGSDTTRRAPSSPARRTPRA